MKFKKPIILFLTLVAAAWILFPFVVLAFFNYPSSDDYYDWMLLQKYGAFEATWHYYFNWSGRYFTHLIAFFLNPLQLGERLGGGFSAFLGIGFLTVNAYLISRILKVIYLVNRCVKALFIIFLILFFGYLPFPNETIYWYTGMIAYLPGFTACLYWLVLHLKDNKHRFERLLWFMLPVFAAGTGELSLCLMAWLLLLNVDFSFENRKYWLLCGLFTLAAGIELLSPGSAERMRYFTDTAGNPTRNIGFAALNSFSWMWHYLRDWTRCSPVLLMAVLCGLLIKTELKITPGFRFYALWLLGCLVPFAMLFIFHFGTGLIHPPGRLINVVYLFVQIYLFTSVFYLVVRYGNVKLLNGERMLWVTTLLFVFLSTYSSRWRVAIMDFSIITAYEKSISTRIRQVEQFRMGGSSSTLLLLPLEHKPSTSFFSELSSDSSHWYNEGFSAYHGIKATRCVINNKP